MAPPAYPTKWKLGNWDAAPSPKHPGCMDFNIKPCVMDADVTKVGWELELKRWERELHGFKKLGTSEATITIEDGFLIIENHEGEKASLRLPKSICSDGPIVEINPDHLMVTLPRRDASAPVAAPA